MNIEKFTISNDPQFYEAWPDLTIAPNGHLLCVFSECTHHCCRSYTRIMLAESADSGRTWSPKRPLTEGTEGLAYFYNCARIHTLSDDKVVVIVDKIPSSGEGRGETAQSWFCTSDDNGKTWSELFPLPLKGIVPDKFRELNGKRLAISAHHAHNGKLSQFLCYSDDGGKTWSEPVLVAHDPRYQLCEGCLIPLGNNTVAALLRENSGLGLDAFKTVSYDNGETWGPLVPFPLPGCHRPVAGAMRDGKYFITYRFLQGGGCGMGAHSQNFFSAFTDRESLLSTTRNEAQVRIIPIDYDRSPKADTGYSGWVQLPDDTLYIVNYIVDDALSSGQIRGYHLDPAECLLPLPSRCGCCNCTKNTCPKYK